MSRWLWSLVLLAGCMPLSEEAVDEVQAAFVAFIIPLAAAAVFSVLTAWGLVAIQRVRWQTGDRRSALRAAIACLLAGGLYGAAALVNVVAVQAARSLPDAEPLLWFSWPGPGSLPGTLLLSLAAGVMLLVGGVAVMFGVGQDPEP